MKINKQIYFSWILSIISTYAFGQKEMKPEDTEVWNSEPTVVTPGKNNAPPSDALVLFDGKDFAQWRQATDFDAGKPMPWAQKRADVSNKKNKGKNVAWTLKDGEMIVKPGTGEIETVESFGSVQLHIEWLAPVDEGKKSQQYSNSGVFLMGLYEIQVLNSYQNRTYSNGQAASIYKQHIPLANASKPPGTWQEYDIIFTAPKFKSNGKLDTPAHVTVLHNGVLVQNNVEIKGPTVYIGHPKYQAHPTKLPLVLQDHGNLVRFRNIWLRELD